MFLDLLKSSRFIGDYKKICEDIRGGFPTAVFGVSVPQKARLISTLEGKVLFIVRDSVTAKNFQKTISAYYGKKAVFLPAKDEVLLYKPTFDKESLYERLTALYEIGTGAEKIVTTPEALLQLFPRKMHLLRYEKGKEYDFIKCPERLVNIGYKRVDFCEKKGEFAVRGDILEIFPINENKAYKIDFFGDEIEKIRDDENNEYSSLTAVMATDVLIKEDEVPSILEEVKKSYKSFGNLIVKDGAKNLYSKIQEKLETDLFDDSLSYVAPLLKEQTHDLSFVFGKNLTVVYDESKIVYQTLLNHEKEYNERADGLIKTGEGLDFIKRQFLSSNELIKSLSNYKQVAVQTLNSVIPVFNPLKTYTLNETTISRYYMKLDALASDILSWKINGYTVLICLDDTETQKRLYFDLTARNQNVTFLENITSEISGVNLAVSKDITGFIQHNEKLVVIGQTDVFPKKSKEKQIKKKRGDLFTAPVVGDYAVHEQYGVGLIKGVKKISTIEGTGEYIELEYFGGDRLYVSTDQMDKLSKYLGGSEKPTLNKIGGGEFERIKERVKQAIAKMTINLKKLYKERRERIGFEFSEDNALTREFEDSFEFEETEDQITSLNEIKEDMESTKVMDRLLCGDVGFGKTEVAFRACFKAIVDGKQAVIVAPTTILTEQHYNTAITRFAGFGVRIAVLNRFKTQEQQKRIIESIEKGEVDLIIGTHRLFSKDIKFKDLGLLVIDEEQRFGVEHKEKLKLLKENVDTLTLSATPIPRTLHLSLSGIRDISSINTPPKQRIPVQTIVTELTDFLIKDAITRELSRKGQVFILYNRVETIYSFAEKVQNIVPNAKISVAHGQMNEKTLENNISAFYKGEYDVLIATTIIENGIDMPRANTLIVESSDRLGLSTLYQLKGRVGRGNLMAYAYFTYDENKVLSETAYKRLSALMEFTEMGSGYKIAMRDLELRGAGNVLGKEQHGQMDKVGYELYNKLLREELGETTLNDEMEMEIKADAYIPDGYIENEGARMNAYKEIAEIENENDRLRIEKSLIDNYGKIPEVTKTLMDIAWLKLLAEKAGGIKLKVSMRLAKLYLKNLDVLKNGNITSKVPKFKDKVTLSFEENPVLTFHTESGKPNDYFKVMIDFLTF